METSGATYSTAQRNITEDLHNPSLLINKSKYALRLTQRHVHFIVILLLATSFGLKRPSYIHTSYGIF
jgi:hypothetical protein